MEGTSVGRSASIDDALAVPAHVADAVDSELEGGLGALRQWRCARGRTWSRAASWEGKAGSDAGEDRHACARRTPRPSEDESGGYVSSDGTENLRVAQRGPSPNRLSYIAIAASMSSRC